MQPETIVDQPLPLIDGAILASTGNNSNPVTSNADVEVPTTQVDKSFPPALIAQETVSQSIDTATKRIKGTYTFESLGAISIGEFQQGISGEIKISPDGIEATNVNGDTTFTLDGSTGNATFKGTLEAQTIIAGDSAIVMETSSNNQGRIVFYNSGVPAIIIGDPS